MDNTRRFHTLHDVHEDAGFAIDATLSRPSRINLNYVSPYLHRSAVYARYRSSRIEKNDELHLVQPSRSSTSEWGRSDKTESFYVTVSRSLSLGATKNKLVVNKSKRRYDSENSEVPTYQTHSEHRRGKMLLINNIMYGQRNYRRGAEEDEKNLIQVFTDIGFDIVKRTDLKEAAILSEIEHFRDKELAESPDVMVLVFMSHGGEGKVLASTTVESADGRSIEIEDILQSFDETKCKSMAGKPKIFIFQCCRGDGYHIQVDAQKLQPKAVLADALIAYSTLPGFVSYRNAVDGSCYVKTLCEVFAEYAHKHDVETLLKLVDDKIVQTYPQFRQRTHYENRSFKLCYLHPI